VTLMGFQETCGHTHAAGAPCPTIQPHLKEAAVSAGLTSEDVAEGEADAYDSTFCIHAEAGRDDCECGQ
jgi:hypothetical protein